MKRVWKIAGGIAAALVIIVAAILYWTTWQGSSKEIEAVADQFMPDSSWQRIDNKVVPPGTVCLEANCPSVHRSWKTGQIVTKEKLKELLERSGWNFAIQGDCVPESNISGSGVGVCSAEGVYGEYKINVEVVGDHIDKSLAKLILYVERNNR